MTLTVLSVAYPLAPVAPNVAGGAEQVLLQLDRALCEAGHRSIVIGCAGSKVAGSLIESGPMPDILDEEAQAKARNRHRDLIETVIASERVDILHMHGLDFHGYMPASGPPTLITLHLPLNLYPENALCPSRPEVWLHCVSAVQHATRPRCARFLPPIENGVAVSAARRNRGENAVFLGRICPEKGVHVAISAARRANVPLIIAGRVFPYKEHLRYFREEVEPHLGPDCRLAGSLGPSEKSELLASARCVLVTSLIQETSSLVAREALAAGTPVVALTSPALAEVIEHGRTGFLVQTPEAMADAIAKCGAIDGDYCRDAARTRFPLAKMIAAYLERYRLIADGRMVETGFQ